MKRKIKNFFKENYKELIIFIVLIILIKWPVNYYIVTGGGTLETDPRVEVKNEYKNKGTFNMCYVSELKGTIATYLLSYVLGYDRENVEESKASNSESLEDIEYRNKLWLASANNAAAYVAYKKAGKTANIKDKGIYIFAKLDESDTDLEVADRLVSIDGEEGKSLEDFKRIINTKNDGSTVKIMVMHNGKSYERKAKVTDIKGKKYIGVELMEYTDYNFDPEVEFKFKDSEGGPSGGLMLSLEIYNELTKKDITHGLNIAGTGMIDEYGNVGEIDGVKYKIRGAEKDSMDAFLVPAGRNYKEAINTKKKYNLKIKVIEVKTFDDALKKIKRLG